MRLLFFLVSNNRRMETCWLNLDNRNIHFFSNLSLNRKILLQLRCILKFLIIRNNVCMMNWDYCIYISAEVIWFLLLDDFLLSWEPLPYIKSWVDVAKWLFTTFQVNSSDLSNHHVWWTDAFSAHHRSASILAPGCAPQKIKWVFSIVFFQLWADVLASLSCNVRFITAVICICRNSCA